MLKFLIVVAGIFAAQTVSAAQLQINSALSLSELNQVKTGYVKLVGDGDRNAEFGTVTTAKILSRSRSEAITQTIKQMIYMSAREYGRPETGITLSAVETNAPGIQSALNTAYDHLNYIEVKTLDSFTRFVIKKIENNDQIQIFEGKYEQAFGSTSFAAFYDSENAEIMILDSSYAE